MIFALGPEDRWTAISRGDRSRPCSSSPAMTRFGTDARPYAFAPWGCHDRHELLVGVRRRWPAPEHCVNRVRRGAAAHRAGAPLCAVDRPGPRRDCRRSTSARSAPRTWPRTLIPGAVAISLMLPWLWGVANHANGSPKPAPRRVPQRPLAVRRVCRTRAAPPASLPLVISCAGCLLGWMSGSPATHTGPSWLPLWMVVPPITLTLMQLATGMPGSCLAVLGLSASRHSRSASDLPRGLPREEARRSWRSLPFLSWALLCIPAQRRLRGVDGHNGHPAFSTLRSDGPSRSRCRFYRRLPHRTIEAVICQ